VIFRTARPILRSARGNASPIYFSASEYLPPIDTGGLPRHGFKQPDPEYSRQQIISVPPDADNHLQTIVTPPRVRLVREVPLPNIVAWSGPNIPVPITATARSTRDLKLPTVETTPLAPPPEFAEVKSQAAPVLSARVIAPPPDVTRSEMHAAQSLRVTVVAPPPEVNAANQRKLGEIEIAHAEPVAPAPELPLAEQHAAPPGGFSGPQDAVAPPPSLGGNANSSAAGHLIALGIHPLPPSGPVEPPAGNRRGSFAAGPDGKAGATATPGSLPDQASNGADASEKPGSSGSGGFGRSAAGLPSGLMVGPAPERAVTSTIEGRGQGGGTGGDVNGATDESRLMADATPPRTSSPVRPATELNESKLTETEKRVFRDRHLYSMTVNLPNLNSAAGSWVIHFVEMKENRAAGDLIAPVPTQSVDPAYPTELIRENVQGTVTLYAVIHSDGSVGDVRVLEGVDDRLNRYATAALARWRFRPATRNGSAVALEAVVMIPFRASLRHGF
jgi:TonB family protein